MASVGQDSLAQGRTEQAHEWHTPEESLPAAAGLSERTMAELSCRVAAAVAAASSSSRTPLHASVVTLALRCHKNDNHDSIVFAFSDKHKQLSCVRGLYTHPADGPAQLIPLSVISTAPGFFAGGTLTIAADPPLVPARVPLLCVFSSLLLWLLYLLKPLVMIGALLCLPVALVLPLSHIYRNGPLLDVGTIAVGFWDGAPLADICGRMTSTNPAFWREKADECAAMFKRKETIFVISVQYLLWGLIVWELVKLLFFALRGRLGAAPKPRHNTV